MKIAALIPLAVMLTISVSEASAATYKSYDSQGHYQGSAVTSGNQAKYYDSHGHFQGSSRW
jgi:hypothetical protein